MDYQSLKDFRDCLKGFLPDETIEKLSVMIPPGIDSNVATMIANIIKKLPPEMAPNQMMDAVMKAMSSKQKGHQAQAADRPGSSRALVRKYYDSLMIEYRLMGAQEPVVETEVFGHRFSSPIMTAALSHLSLYRKGAYGKLEQFAQGAAAANILHWVGMADNDQFAQIMETGAKTVRIIKPYADEQKIFDQIRCTESMGAVAVGMDIDHTLTSTGELDMPQGELMERKSMKQMLAYVQASRLPFVIKGVLSVHDALACKEIGAKGIVVSHHGGRLAYSVPPAMLLPEIRAAAGKDMRIFVDCGICSGMDAYKALALGADAVGVGTHLMEALNKGGTQAVACRIQEMTAELKGVMSFTGVENCQSFDASVLRSRNF